MHACRQSQASHLWPFCEHELAAVQERSDWQHDFLETEVVASTGPWMLTDTLKEHLHIRSRSVGEYIRATGEVIVQGKNSFPHHINEVGALSAALKSHAKMTCGAYPLVPTLGKPRRTGGSETREGLSLISCMPADLESCLKSYVTLDFSA